MSEESKNLSTQKEKVEVSTLYPATDIYENKEGVILYVDLPGVSKETLNIDVDQDILTIRGAINLKTQEKMQPTYMDIRAEVFERRFTLGDELDTSRIEANLNQGALKLLIPRSEQHKPQQIHIKVA